MSQPPLLRTLSPSGGPAPATRCRVALDGPSSQFDTELARLLHARLFLVACLAFVPFALFLARDLADPNRDAAFGPVALALRVGVCAFLGGLALLLWPRRSWALCPLRKLELALLAVLAGYFGWLQVWGASHPSTLFYVAESYPELELVRLWIDRTATRWFFLIVIYGVFIPNSWQRTLVITGLISLLPIVLTPLAADRAPREVLHGVLDLFILLGTGVAVAVFGSYRLQLLQRQAFQAQQLGQYRLKRRIGSGGMGEVYEAEHLLLRRRCAIKLIRPDQTRDPAVLDRFEREVQAMATLTHRNTVEVYDYGHADDGTFYYVMEYLPGMTLEQLVARHGPVPPERAIHFLRQMCRALREAHGIGLLHRDIKPSNIIACERGGEPDVAKLLDFGLVQTNWPEGEAKKLTMQGMVLGSPPFMSPEQAAGRSDLDVRTDIYSLGGVGYFLLTGRQPFERETAMELMLAHAYEEVEPPSAIRPEVAGDLEAVILRCLSKKAAGRYADAAELEKALMACESAGAWTEERAAAWWREVGGPPETSPEMPTRTPTFTAVPG